MISTRGTFYETSSLSGCSSLLNPFSCCSLMPMCNTTGGCVSGQYWCHLLEICLPVTSPCSPYHSSTRGRVFPLPPRYSATPPFFHLMADMSLTLPASTDLTHISVGGNSWLVHHLKTNYFLQLCNNNNGSTMKNGLAARWALQYPSNIRLKSFEIIFTIEHARLWFMSW